MESRKIILTNLFARQRHIELWTNRLMDTGRVEERVSCMERVTWKLTLPYVKYPKRICYMSQRTQTGALYQSRGLGWGGR